MAPKWKRFDRRNPKKNGQAKPKAKEGKRLEGEKQKVTRSAWNKGKKPSKTNKQHIFIPRDHLSLYFACALYFAGPIYCAALWVCLITSRRISETLFYCATAMLIWKEVVFTTHPTFYINNERKIFICLDKANLVRSRLLRVCPQMQWRA